MFDWLKKIITFSWLKNLFIGSIKKVLLAEIDHLDSWKDDLANLIRQYIDPDKSAKIIVNYVQERLRFLVEQIFGGK